MSTIKPVLDKAMEKLLSRKLMVWSTATYLMLFTSSLASEDWVAISLAYIGIQGLADIATRWRHGS
ncbi:MAG: hypothetical protein GOVbin630_67 [Prokaryotic dsDNA virus sp.]|mgnify:FL=1|nr:MAG: hypothetical protein GOVbin630_67 [Prokaryotic dsDNA virus sp.]|tara:strand:- start:7238 stop:7435 length:198 start_codon:yes stop_codon:yes gene_type:complete